MHGPRQFRGQHGQRFALALVACPLGARRFARLGLPSAQDRRCRARPLELGVATLLPPEALPVARRLLGALEEATGRDDSVPARQAGAVRALREEAAGEHVAEARDGLPAGEARRGMPCGRARDREVEGAPQLVLLGTAGAGPRHAVAHPGRRAVRFAPLPVGFVGQLRAERGAGGVSVGVVAVGAQVGPLAPAGTAAAPPVARGPPLRRVARGLRQPPAPPQEGARGGGNLVVLGFAAVAGLQRESRAEHAGTVVRGPESGEPGAGETALPRDHQGVGLRRAEAQNRCGRRGQSLMDQNRAALVEQTDVQRAGV